MSKPTLILLGASMLLVALGCAPEPANGRVYEYRGGRWFNGESFESRDVYVVNGVFVANPASPPDSIIELSGKFVVPPFAEAHNHWLEPAAVDAYIQAYLRDGIFYVQDQGNAPSVRARIDSLLNRPTSVDFISANQGWTGPGGHPIQIARQFVAFGTFPSTWTDADLDKNVMMVVHDSADVAERWPLFVAGRPDFAKVFLLYSEEYEQRSRDTAYRFHRGIDPALVPNIVRRAHAAGLKVSAHIYTAADFRNAVDGGVDLIAHFPGTGYEPRLGPAAFRITDADASAAAQHEVRVITTLGWLREEEDSAQRVMLVRDVIRPNLALLRQHEVPILIGSDQFRQTSAPEAQDLVTLGLFTPKEALQSWAVTTPKAIFPQRRIGELSPGYEASFLALNGDPIADFGNTSRIALRVKQGVVLRLKEPAPTFPPLGK